MNRGQAPYADRAGCRPGTKIAGGQLVAIDGGHVAGPPGGIPTHAWARAVEAVFGRCHSARRGTVRRCRSARRRGVMALVVGIPELVDLAGSITSGHAIELARHAGCASASAALAQV